MLYKVLFIPSRGKGGDTESSTFPEILKNIKCIRFFLYTFLYNLQFINIQLHTPTFDDDATLKRGYSFSDTLVYYSTVYYSILQYITVQYIIVVIS